jgi:uncharacterized membrane protein
MPLCSRCTGILLGYICGGCAIAYGTHAGVVPLLCVMAPLIVDGLGQYRGRWKSTNARRLVTGGLFGCAFPLFLRLLLLNAYQQGLSIGNLAKASMGGP